MDLSFCRSAIASLAVNRGGCAMRLSWCQARGDVSKTKVKRRNIISYAFMATSMILFISMDSMTSSVQKPGDMTAKKVVHVAL